MLNTPLGDAAERVIAKHMPELTINCRHPRCRLIRQLHGATERIRYYECIGCHSHYWCEVIPKWLGEGPREVTLVQGFCNDECRDVFAADEEDYASQQ